MAQGAALANVGGKRRIRGFQEFIMTSFDTLSYTKRLEVAGVPAEQAEAHAMALVDVLSVQTVSKIELNSSNGDLTTRIDRLNDDLNTKIERLRDELNTKIDRMNADLTARIDGLELFVKEQVAILRAEMKEQKAEMLKWMFAFLVAQTSVIIAVLRYMLH